MLVEFYTTIPSNQKETQKMIGVGGIMIMEHLLL